MSGYIKYFDDGGKNMSFVTDDKEVYEKYNEIWEVVRKLLKLKFTVSPVGDDKYLIAKLKIFKKINRTTFTDNVVPDENTQAYLEECKYKLKKRKSVSFIDSEIIEDEDYEIINDKSDNKNDDDYPCIYGRMVNF